MKGGIDRGSCTAGDSKQRDKEQGNAAGGTGETTHRVKGKLEESKVTCFSNTFLKLLKVS